MRENFYFTILFYLNSLYTSFVVAKECKIYLFILFIYRCGCYIKLYTSYKFYAQISIYLPDSLHTIF